VTIKIDKKPTSASAVPQSMFTPMSISIREIHNQSSSYMNYAAYQRGYVWPMTWKQTLIDSILRGYPIHPIIAIQDYSEEDVKYFIIDGQQRMRTVSAFLANDFKTLGNNRKENEHGDRIEPNRYFRDLTPIAYSLGEYSSILSRWTLLYRFLGCISSCHSTRAIKPSSYSR